MKSLHSWRLLPLSALLCVFAFACKKNASPTSGQTQQQTMLMNGTNDVVQAAMLDNGDVEDIVGDSTTDSSCAVITFNPSRTVYPHTKTIDFGSGCTSPDGLVRKGKKIITVYADANTSPAGTLISKTTYDNFSINDINVSGEVDSYVDSAANPGPRVIKNVANKNLSASNGDTKTYTSTMYWKQIEGADSKTRMDDVFQVTGSGSGNETLDGATAIQWTMQVDALNPVIKPADCGFRTQGVLDVGLHIVTGGGSDFTETLDYGNGSCDNQATLAINGGTPQTVTLPLFFWPLSL